MDPFDGSEGSDTIAVEDQASKWEWYERVPWDDDMREVHIEIPHFIIRLLQHNNLPTSEDIRLCKKYQEKLQGPLLSVQTRIQSVISQIDAFQAELRELEKEKIGYTKQSFACDVVCSSVRRLPSEIVQELTTHLLLPPHHLLFGRDPLISMSQVCSGWRKALTSVPRLWAQFGIDTMKIARSNYQAVLKKAILEYSERSKPFPLDIQVSLSDHELRSTKHERSHQLLSWLISDWSSIDRVRRLHMTSFHFLNVLADEIKDPGAFSKLERLVLLSGRSMKPLRSNRIFDDSTDWGNLFMNAANLRRISVDNKIGQFFHNLHLPFSQITHLFLACSLSFGSWTTLLSRLSALRFGFFSLDGQSHSGYADHDSPLLEHLTVIPKSFEVYAHCSELIRKGRFPKLSHVEFVVPSSETWYHGEVSSLSIPGVPLKKLSLFFVEQTPIEVLLTILRNSPDVTYLELGLSASQWGPLFNSLTSEDPSTGHQILPMLNTLVAQALVPTDTLSWKGSYFETSLCQEFVDMIQSRCAPSETLKQPLHTVYLLLVQHPDYQLLLDDARKALSPCLQAGLSLKMRNLGESLEDNRYISCRDADWDSFVPELPPSYSPPRNEGPLI